MKYRKKPVVIEAVQFDYPNMDEVADFCDPHSIMIGPRDKHGQSTLLIPTLEGKMQVHNGDFIIKGVNGEVYPCKPDIFYKTYEAVE